MINDLLTQSKIINRFLYNARMAELVDASVSNTDDLTVLSVRPRLRVQIRSEQTERRVEVSLLVFRRSRFILRSFCGEGLGLPLELMNTQQYSLSHYCSLKINPTSSINTSHSRFSQKINGINNE